VASRSASPSRAWVIACVCALAQFTVLPASGQPAGKPQLGDVFACAGQRAGHYCRLLRPAAVGKPAGKLTAGMIVAAAGSLAQLVNLVIAGQAVRLPPRGGIAWVCSWRIDQGATSPGLALPAKAEAAQTWRF
jgi:hypothetical protein